MNGSAVPRGVAAATGPFVLCAALTAAGALDGLDRGVAEVVARTARHAGDVVMSWLALPASAQLSAGWLAILAVAAWRRPWWRGRVAALAGLVVVGVAVELALKMLIGHPAPHPARSAVALGGGDIGHGSFPSGHAFRGTALAFGTALLARPDRRRDVLAVATGYSAALAWGLVYLNWHWTSDVTGGVLLGLCAAAIVATIPVYDPRTGP